MSSSIILSIFLFFSQLSSSSSSSSSVGYYEGVVNSFLLYRKKKKLSRHYEGTKEKIGEIWPLIRKAELFKPEVRDTVALKVKDHLLDPENFSRKKELGEQEIHQQMDKYFSQDLVRKLDEFVKEGNYGDEEPAKKIIAYQVVAKLAAIIFEIRMELYPDEKEYEVVLERSKNVAVTFFTEGDIEENDQEYMLPFHYPCGPGADEFETHVPSFWCGYWKGAEHHGYPKSSMITLDNLVRAHGLIADSNCLGLKIDENAIFVPGKDFIWQDGANTAFSVKQNMPWWGRHSRFYADIHTLNVLRNSPQGICAARSSINTSQCAGKESDDCRDSENCTWQEKVIPISVFVNKNVTEEFLS